MSTIKTVFVPANNTLTVTTDAQTSGNMHQSSPGAANGTNVAITAGADTEVGPFADSREYTINITGNTPTITIAPSLVTDTDTTLTLIDDDTMATAAATNVPSAESVVAYVATAGGGSFTKISTTLITENTATVEFQGLTSAYRAYMLVYTDVIPETDAQFFIAHLSTVADQWHTTASDYLFTVNYDDTGDHSGKTDSGDVTTAICPSALSGGTGTGESQSGTITIYNPSSATGYCKVTGVSSNHSSDGDLTNGHMAGSLATEAGAAVLGIRLLFGSGDIASGTFTLYGLEA